MPAGHVVGGDEQLVGRQLGRAVQIDRIGRLVGRQRDDLLDVVRSAAWITFSAPWMLVLMHSMGLYSAAGTCLSAAAWMTKSTPLIACIEALAVAHVADEDSACSRASKSCCISNCLSSSRE